MDERAPQFESARRELEPLWNAERSARLYQGTLRLQKRRESRRAALYGSATFAAALLLGLGITRLTWPKADSATPVAGALRPPAGHTLRLADGSRADLLGEKSEIEAVADTAERIVLKLVAGRAHFDVVPNPARSFEVEAPPYRVQVIGTVFDVDRSGGRVQVTVTRGHVRVHGPLGPVDLVAGERRSFDTTPAPTAKVARSASRADTRSTEPVPPTAPTAAPIAEPTPVAEPTPAPAAVHREPGTEDRRAPAARDPQARHRAASGPNTSTISSPTQVEASAGDEPPESWRSLSRGGQYDAAFESLRRGEPVAEDPAALMDAADAARLSGHAQSAARYLSRVARGHRKSPVAPLAAFTLGRVYLEDLGQPELAAQAFELARALAPGGSMAQDALAREVEAWSKAGDASKAYSRAQQYMNRYPSGRRSRAVQLYGGLH